MQIHSTTPIAFSPLGSLPGEKQATDPKGAKLQPGPARALADVPPAAPASVDISGLSLENQLVLGKSKGVFTKVTYSREGIMANRPVAQAGANPPDFVSAAVTIMRDYEEGLAALRSPGGEAIASRANAFWSNGLKDLKSAAAKLNVFA